MRRLTVYYRPDCAFSMGTVAFLILRGADYALVNLDQHPDQAERLEARLGDDKLETPCLELDGGQLLVAPSMSALKEMLEEWGLPDVAAPYTRERAGAKP